MLAMRTAMPFQYLQKYPFLDLDGEQVNQPKYYAIYRNGRSTEMKSFAIAIKLISKLPKGYFNIDDFDALYLFTHTHTHIALH